MGGIVTKEQEISHAQYLDLVYSRTRTVYKLIPNALHLSTSPTCPSQYSHVDGMVESFKTWSATWIVTII